MRDEKTGDLIPPNQILGHTAKYIKVKMQPVLTTNEMIDAQLGRSNGIKQKYNIEETI